MAWALSCLKLNEQGFPIVLYTDSEGYDVLIKKMHLPYSEAIVKYCDLLCRACQWAYGKQMTKMKVHVNAAGHNGESVQTGAVYGSSGFVIDEDVQNFMSSMGNYNIDFGSRSVSYWSITYENGEVASSIPQEFKSFSVSVTFRLWGYEERFGLHGEGSIE